MTPEASLVIAMFISLFALLFLGFPVAFTLPGVALIFASIASSIELFRISDFGFIPSKAFGIVSNVTLMAVPMFVFMGIMLEESGIAARLLHSLSNLFGRIRGGLALSIVLVGALLAASTGIVGATIVTLSVLALPTLISKGYDRRLACGTIAASGTLGQILPPSILLVLLGDLVNVDVGSLFLGAIIPGLLLVTLYLIYIAAISYVSPQLTPVNFQSTERISILEIVINVFPPIALVGIVLGSIIFGFASPTESAACGAMGSIILTALSGKLSFAGLRRVMNQTARISAMVFTLLIGAQIFSVVFRGISGDEVIVNAISELSLSREMILFTVMGGIFFLGFFLDFLEICFIVIPIVFPILVGLGFDKLWLAIMIALNLQTSFLTPPFGFALFYLKGSAPPEIKTMDIYRGVTPFVLLQLLALTLLYILPDIATWLPSLYSK